MEIHAFSGGEEKTVGGGGGETKNWAELHDKICELWNLTSLDKNYSRQSFQGTYNTNYIWCTPFFPGSTFFTGFN